MDALAVNPKLLVAMDRFHEIADGAAILVNKGGVYRQVKLFQRGNELYAGSGGGFLRLMANGNTSSPHQRYVGLDAAGLNLAEDRLGRLLTGVSSG